MLDQEKILPELVMKLVIVGSGGAVKKSAVDVSPLRRLNQAIYLICCGARSASFRTARTIAECLADELIACAAV